MGITSNVAFFDRWIRTSFVEMNTELEGVYWTQVNKADVQSGGDDIKQRLLEEGRSHLNVLLEEPGTLHQADEPAAAAELADVLRVPYVRTILRQDHEHDQTAPRGRIPQF